MRSDWQSRLRVSWIDLPFKREQSYIYKDRKNLSITRVFLSRGTIVYLLKRGNLSFYEGLSSESIPRNETGSTPLAERDASWKRSRSRAPHVCLLYAALSRLPQCCLRETQCVHWLGLGEVSYPWWESRDISIVIIAPSVSNVCHFLARVCQNLRSSQSERCKVAKRATVRLWCPFIANLSCYCKTLW